MSTAIHTAMGTAGQSAFLQELVDAGHFLPSGEPGVYGRGQIFEQVRNRFDALVNSYSEQDSPEMPRFPPLIRP